MGDSGTKLRHISLTAASAMGPPPPGNLAVPVFAVDDLEVELYEPRGADPQKPHTRDELYVVARGRGHMFDGEKRQALEAGSFIFVPAGQLHRFEDFSDDFAVWVVAGRDAYSVSPASAAASSARAALRMFAIA